MGYRTNGEELDMATPGPRERKRAILDRAIGDIGEKLFHVNGRISGLQREREELADLDRRMRGLRAALDTHESGQGCNPDRLGLAG
jgi:hypothetical protein